MSRLSRRCLLAGAALAALAAPSSPAQEAEPALQDIIIVTTARLTDTATAWLHPEALPFEGGDVTHLTARTPGGARIANGAVSGQVQYRGLFGERLNLRVDGQRFASGGPNLMDPVFHYAPEPLVAALVIDRGVSPVSAGPGLGGGADAVFKRIDYAGDGDVRFGYDVSLAGRSVNESVAAGGVVGAATKLWRVNLLGAYEEGGDTAFDDGEIAGTAFERGVFGASAGVRTHFGEVTLDLRRQNTGPSGNPPFPMDIIYFDTDFAKLGYRNEIGAVRMSAALHHADVAHLMDNFTQRPTPPAMRQRATFADATTRGGEVRLGLDAFGGDVLFGLDGERVQHDITITNPGNEAFVVTPFPEIGIDRLGGFAEWTGPLGPLTGELGLRIDEHGWEAGEASLGPALPMGPRMLAVAFNAAERSGDETTVDLVARVWTAPTDGLSWRATLARKQRVPGYIQRFGWLPINASGGLADGNIYVGDLALQPETAWIAEAGFDLLTERAYLRPTVYLRDVDDYIQGVPFDASVGVVDTPVEMIAAMNGDPTPLRWANVDARLHGLDLDGGYDLQGPLRIDGVFSYVRGERRDIEDDLYRIAPPRLDLGLTWQGRGWSATVETRALARQERVSDTNSEAQTEGYVLLNTRARVDLSDGVSLSAGIENLLDHSYEDHLSGYNRNGFGDVPLGERVPGPGRGAFVRLSLAR